MIFSLYIAIHIELKYSLIKECFAALIASFTSKRFTALNESLTEEAGLSLPSTFYRA